jgi:probable H4MPT-linked C1 transfer pathway protein
LTSRDVGWLALDIGGANLKAAHSAGAVASVPFAVWKHPEGLADAVRGLTERLPSAGRVAVTMTAESCDCFTTRSEGVRAVVNALARALPARPLAVWGLDARFHSTEDVLDDPLVAAAANWLALAEAAAQVAGAGAGLLVDVGSTTTDLVPLRDGRAEPRGRTDRERLALGELVYAGVRRTPVCALAESLPYRGLATALAAEVYATTLDVFLTLGRTDEDPSDLDTADGRPATADDARARLARMVGEDPDDFTAEDSRRLAAALSERLLGRLVAACEARGHRPGVVVVSGSGEGLADTLARRVVAPGGRVVRLSDRWGRAGSTAACARALLELVTQEKRWQGFES